MERITATTVPVSTPLRGIDLGALSITLAQADDLLAILALFEKPIFEPHDPYVE